MEFSWSQLNSKWNFCQHGNKLWLAGHGRYDGTQQQIVWPCECVELRYCQILPPPAVHPAVALQQWPGYTAALHSNSDNSCILLHTRLPGVLSTAWCPTICLVTTTVSASEILPCPTWQHLPDAHFPLPDTVLPRQYLLVARCTMWLFLNWVQLRGPLYKVFY